MTPFFFNWVETSVKLCASGSQIFEGFILKVRDVKIDREYSTFN